MKNIGKSKFGTVLVVLITLVLAGVAIYTAIRLYQLRQTSVAPNVPSSFPQAAEIKTNNCKLTFTIGSTASPSETPTSTPTETPTETPTSTPTATPNSCNGTCGSNANCSSNLVCSGGFCRNPSCTQSTSCACAGTSTPAPTPTSPTLPSSGTDWPTYAGAALGVFVIIGSLLLAL